MGVRYDWAKCCNCGQRCQVKKKLWLRAARPRCMTCGGPLEQSEAARDGDIVHNGKRDEIKRQRKATG